MRISPSQIWLRDRPTGRVARAVSHRPRTFPYNVGMKYRYLGNTGVRVSRICLGCMSFQAPGHRAWTLDEEAAQPFFRRAVEAGINFFDTADAYGIGSSEEITGRALARYARRDEIVIATKVFFPMTSGPNMGGLSRKHIQQACEDSLRRLGVDCIDLYQIHRLDPRTPIEETLEALDQLVRQGKVRYIGASSMYAWEFARTLGISERERLAKFVSMQNHYNLIYREEEREMNPLCEYERVSLIPWSPLARGILAGGRSSIRDREASARAAADGDLVDRLYDQQSDWDVVEALREVSEKRGAEPAQVALAWLLSKPAVAAPIVGVTKLAHLDSAIGAVEVSLEPEEIARLEAPYRPHAVRGLGPSAMLAQTQRR
jgi:1-deoxyxylulose-5-phosphate synthase